jgi:CRISPR/Cas system-associated exonuclease Cas4 (RecB family)
MHEALAAGYGVLVRDHPPPPTYDLVRARATEALAESWEAEQVPWSEGYDEAADIIGGFFTDELCAAAIQQQSIVATELRFTATLTGVDRQTGEVRPVNVAGVLDLLVTLPAGLQVVDHKFGRLRPVVTDRQLATYVVLTEANFGPCASVALNYPRLKRWDVTDIDRGVLQPTVDWLATTRSRIEEDTTYTPYPGEQCSRCEYQGICPDAAPTPELP